MIAKLIQLLLQASMVFVTVFVLLQTVVPGQDLPDLTGTELYVIVLLTMATYVIVVQPLSKDFFMLNKH